MTARMTPILPCRDLDEAISFYEALGFQRTYRQQRPNPYAVVQLGEIHIHLFGMDGFDPADSYGSVIIQVPEPDLLYESLASSLRAAYGKLPAAGIPRILRPRKRQGTVYGFTVVDAGGNWLRFSRLGDTEEAAATEDQTAGLARVISNAARLGDAHDDVPAAISLLDNGLRKFSDAPNTDKVRTLLYRAELAGRIPEPQLARSSLAEAMAIDLTEAEKTSLRSDLEATAELVEDL